VAYFEIASGCFWVENPAYDLRSSSGSLAKFAAMRRASSLVSGLAAERRPNSSSK